MMLGIVHPCVYILASKRNGTLYVGVTAEICTTSGQAAEAARENRRPKLCGGHFCEIEDNNFRQRFQ